jgi:hypothetical protein
MEHALQELVQALKLDTEFFQGGVKHRRSIAKPKPSQNLKRSKKRKAKDQNDPLNDGDSPMQMDEISPTQLQSESSRQTEESLSQNDEEAAILIPATAVHEENVPIEIQELWDIEPSSIIGLGAFGIVRFERRRPQIANSTQTSHNQVRAVKEIRKASTVDYMKELQAIAKFSQSQVCHLSPTS